METMILQYRSNFKLLLQLKYIDHFKNNDFALNLLNSNQKTLCLVKRKLL